MSAVWLSILHCTVVISHKFGALITSSKPWLLETNSLPGKTWNRADLWYTKLLTQQDKKQTKERNILTKVTKNKASMATLVVGMKRKFKYIKTAAVSTHYKKKIYINKSPKQKGAIFVEYLHRFNNYRFSSLLFTYILYVKLLCVIRKSAFLRTQVMSPTDF